jgi:hypothetical protein
MSRLKKILELRKQLRELGNYDTSIAGAVGEVYAEEVLGMVKAPKGTKGIDGYINGRAVQVKTKEGKLRKDSATYASIRHGLENDIDDLVVIILNGDEVSHIDPVPLSEIPYSDHKQGRRYFLHKIKGYLDQKESK